MSEEEFQNELRERIQAGNALLEVHEQWDEAIRRGDQPFYDGQEIQIKNALALWLDKTQRLAFVATKIQDLLANWKTPKLYILPSMRTQVIRGEGVKKFMELVEEGKAQKARRNNDRT